MLAHYNQQDENGKRLQSAGIPLITTTNGLSRHLARAEWIKLVATLRQRQVACNLFSNTEQRYNEIKSIAKKLNTTRLLAGGTSRTWYVLGGCYMDNCSDAGADYFTKTIQQQAVCHSILKRCYTICQSRRVLNAPGSALQELYNMDERHHLFKSAQQQRVYGFFARTKAGGANDFW